MEIKLVAYPLQDVADQSQLLLAVCGFLGKFTFSSLPLLSERRDSRTNVRKPPERIIWNSSTAGNEPSHVEDRDIVKKHATNL